MMRAVNRLNRYILRQMAGPMAFFLLSLTGVVWLTQSLRFVDWVFNKGVSVGFFLYLTMLILPSVLAIVLPIALFAAVLYTYQRLRAESELVVMAAVGVGPMRLTGPAISMAILATLVGYVLTLYLTPLGHRAFRDVKIDIRTNIAQVPLQEGAFNTLGRDLTVYIRERRGNGELRGILVHDNREPERPTTMMAERGVLVSTPAGPRLVLVQGNQQQIESDDKRLTMLRFERYTIDLSQFVKTPSRIWYEAKERFLPELLFPGDTPNDRKFRGKFRATAHDQLSAPLYNIVFTMMALAAILGGSFDRRGQARRIALVIAAVIGVRLAGLAAVNLAAKSPFLTPLIYLNLLAVLTIAVIVLRRQPNRRADELEAAETN